MVLIDFLTPIATWLKSNALGPALAIGISFLSHLPSQLYPQVGQPKGSGWRCQTSTSQQMLLDAWFPYNKCFFASVKNFIWSHRESKHISRVCLCQWFSPNIPRPNFPIRDDDHYSERMVILSSPSPTWGLELRPRWRVWLREGPSWLFDDGSSLGASHTMNLPEELIGLTRWWVWQGDPLSYITWHEPKWELLWR